MRWSQKTEKGLVRPENEDYLCVCPDVGFFAVADGMGGHRAGEVASKLAVQILEQFLRVNLDRYTDVALALVEGMQEANRVVHEKSMRSPDCYGMGTTLSCLLIRKRHLYLAHVGDSRIYLLQKGCIFQLTEDHSVYQEMFKNNSIPGGQANHYPYRHILTRALGVKPSVEVDTCQFSLQPRDLLLLCTDGLSGLVNEHELRTIIYQCANLDQAVTSLVNLALSRGGNDNISVILVTVDEDYGRENSR